MKKVALNVNCTRIQFSRRKTDVTLQDETIGFCRKMDQNCGGTVSPYKKHLFICTGTKNWPNEISKWPGHFIESFSAQFRKNLGSKSTQIKVTATDEPSKHQGSFDFLLWPAAIQLHHITESNTSKLLQFLETESTNREDIQSSLNSLGLEHSWMLLDEKWVFVCSHQARDSRCGFCGPILTQNLQEKLSNQPNVHIRACSHVGGHEYAGNVLVFPSAEWFGYVTPAHLEELAQWIKQPSSQQHQMIGEYETLKKLWRGNMGSSKEEQRAQCTSWGVKYSEK